MANRAKQLMVATGSRSWLYFWPYYADLFFPYEFDKTQNLTYCTFIPQILNSVIIALHVRVEMYLSHVKILVLTNCMQK